MAVNGAAGNAAREKTTDTPVPIRTETTGAAGSPPEEQPPAGRDIRAGEGTPAPLLGFIPRNPGRLIVPVVIGVLVVVLIALLAHSRAQSRKLAEEIAGREQIEEQLAGMEQNLTDKIRELNDTSNGLQEATSDRDRIQGELSALQSDHDQMKTQLESTRTYTRTLEDRLKAEQDTIAELQSTAKDDRETQKRLFEKIENLLEEKKSLQDQVFQSQAKTGANAVEMPGLVVTDKRAASPSLQGIILTVDQEYSFVVFNRGESDGVKAGDRFRVMDRDKEIGEVVATRVLPDMTVADIDARKTHRNLRKGFTVFLNE